MIAAVDPYVTHVLASLADAEARAREAVVSDAMLRAYLDQRDANTRRRLGQPRTP